MEKELTGFELEKGREVTTHELDLAIKNLKEARDAYDVAKAISSEKHSVVEKLEGALLGLLDAADKSVYEAEGIARVSVSLKTQVTTPKTIDEKERFFKWVENKLGREGLLAYQTVNYQSLNSLYNTAMKEALDKGEEWNGIDGLEMPTVVKTLSMRAR